MTDTVSIMTTALAGLAGLSIIASAGLSGWRGWLELQQAMLSTAQRPDAPSPAGARIELADLRERVRKLEAIAAGIDL